MSEGGPEGGGRVGARIMAERKQKRYFRLTRSERASIEREFGKRRPSARDVARDLGRSPASISDEVKRNRTVARGLSPAQIACGRADRFKVHPTTIYRWIAAGYAGMSDAELRRKVGYKPRREPSAAKPTSHGPERSYKAFSALPEEG